MAANIAAAAHGSKSQLAASRTNAETKPRAAAGVTRYKVHTLSDTLPSSAAEDKYGVNNSTALQPCFGS